MNAGRKNANIAKKRHHKRFELCATRPPYRRGNKPTAVKVYTIHDESQHLIIRNVPAVKLRKELKNLCARYGEIKSFNLIADYADDEEAFTEVYRVQYVRIQSARFAKRMLDEKSFFGGILYVCYAPELESLSETKRKLEQRIEDVTRRVKLREKSSAT